MASHLSHIESRSLTMARRSSRTWPPITSQTSSPIPLFLTCSTPVALASLICLEGASLYSASGPLQWHSLCPQHSSLSPRPTCFCCPLFSSFCLNITLSLTILCENVTILSLSQTPFTHTQFYHFPPQAHSIILSLSQMKAHVGRPLLYSSP